jgi:hypothetical protein
MKCLKLLSTSFISSLIAFSISTSAYSQPNDLALKHIAKKSYQVEFNTATVKPYVDEMTGLLAALKAVKTPQQAAAIATQLNKELPKIEFQHKRLVAAMEHLGDSIVANKVTPEMTQAMNVWSETEAKAGPEIETEMNRIAKIYPQIGGLFQRYLATYADEEKATPAK